MKTQRVYSNLFSCLYDEPAPIGRLGRGTHYSVFRAVEWLDVCRKPLAKPEIHDFAVIWDEDHDTRIIRTVEEIYMAGLLSPIQFIGERKATLTALVAAKFWWAGEPKIDEYKDRLFNIAQNACHGDCWMADVGMFDRQPGSPHQTDVQSIIHDGEHRVITYLRNIDSLWSLGTKKFEPSDDVEEWAYPGMPEPVE